MPHDRPTSSQHVNRRDRGDARSEESRSRFIQQPRADRRANSSAPATAGASSRFIKQPEPSRRKARPSTPAPAKRPDSLLDRRSMIAGAAALGAGAVGGVVWLTSRGGEDDPVEDGAFVVSTTGAPASPKATAPIEPTAAPEFAGPLPAGERVLVETSVADLSVAIESGATTSVALIEAATDRYTRYDNVYRSVIELNPDAAEIAASLDAELADGQSRGPLHGIPVLLKDVIATGDQMLTTSGALALGRNNVVEDATIARRLREAGAVIIGKTNMSEWSGVRANGQVPGWSGRGGQTRNPYNREMSCWGSSSGSAASVAMSYAPIAIGVETNGSIVAPAAACGIVGLKPTVGLVSRVGVIPVSTTWDSPGPMARTVADIAAAMNVIAGYDPDDPAYGEFEWASPAATVGGSPVHEFDEVDYLEALDAEALRGARLGVCWSMWGMDRDADDMALAVIGRLKTEMGVEIVEDVPMPPLEQPEMLEGSADMVNAEFAAGTTSFFARYTPDGPMMTLLDVAAWNDAHPDPAMKTVGQEGLVETGWAMSRDDEEYLEILDRVTTAARVEGIDAVMEEYALDALISPTTAVPTPIDSDKPFPGAASKLSAISGYPGISLPMGYVRGLPVGLYLVGRAFSEQRLIGYAYAIEQMLRARVPPKI